MKRLLLIFLLLFSSYSHGETITLYDDGMGTFNVPVIVNQTLALPFTLDTGASGVTLSYDAFVKLREAGTVTNEDIIGEGTALLADGSTVPITVFTIRELKIGTRLLTNVQASASAPGTTSAFLLGQSALRMIEPWRLDSANKQLLLGDRSDLYDSSPVEDKKWYAIKNGAIGQNGIGINFPFDHSPAKLVVCDKNAVNPNKSEIVNLRIGVALTEKREDVYIYEGELQSNEDGSCWTNHISDEILSDIKNGIMLLVGVSYLPIETLNSPGVILYRTALNGSANALNQAWAYSEQRSLKTNEQQKQ